MKLFRVLATLCVAAGLAVPAAAQTTASAPADVTGSWDVNFTTQQGPIPGYLKLKKDGEKLVGSVGSQMGEAPAEAEVKGKTLTIWFTFQGNSGPMAIEMSGTVDGDKIAGSFSLGGQPGGEWVATRSKDAAAKETPKDPAKDPTKDQPTPAAKIDLTGTWNVSVELPNMTATPTIALKQEGEKLTGDYTSAQYGKFPLAGTLKGSDVTFSFSMSVEGSPIEVTYAGAVDKDGAIKGSVNYGDMMSGTFVATKKK
jgi:hypothetical protein